MIDANKENTYKLITLGDANVGKSSFLKRYLDGDFAQCYASTIGAEFETKTFIDFADGEARKLQLWDTAGQERFKAMSRSYYRYGDACIICFSLTERKSFEHVSNWVGELEMNSSDNITKILIGCKSDLLDRREVSQEEGQKLAESFGIKYAETSSKSGEGVQEVMKIFTGEIFSKPSINAIAK